MQYNSLACRERPKVPLVFSKTLNVLAAFRLQTSLHFLMTSFKKPLSLALSKSFKNNSFLSVYILFKQDDGRRPRKDKFGTSSPIDMLNMKWGQRHVLFFFKQNSL